MLDQLVKHTPACLLHRWAMHTSSDKPEQPVMGLCTVLLREIRPSTDRGLENAMTLRNVKEIFFWV